MSNDEPVPPDPAPLLRDALERGPGLAAPWPAPPIDTLAGHFPEFELVERIGQGGMAAVYRAIQTKLGRTVALKVLRPDLASQGEFVERFLREARALGSLSHAHVLTVHDFGERGGFCYLVTEFVDGANLRELMELGPMSPAEVLRLVPQICAGLQYAHEHGVVHRDIKPENVLVDRHGQVKLADFGLAKLLPTAGSPTLTRESMVFGTPQYMAPEQWRSSKAVDHRADIYSLGVVLYELLTGKLPIGRYVPPSQNRGVPPGMDAVVERSLEQEPERRYQSAGEVRRDVERESRQLDPAQRPAAAPRRAVVDPGRLGGQVMVMLGATLLIVSLLGLLIFVGEEFRRHGVADALVEQRAEREALVAAIRARVAAGAAWDGTVPDAASLWAPAPLAPWLALALGVAWLLGTFVLVPLLGAAASRRLSVAGAGRAWRLAARLVTWLPLLVVGDAALFAACQGQRHGPYAVLATLMAVVVGLATNGGLVFWLWQRCGAVAGEVPPARSAAQRLLFAGAVWCGALLLAGSVGAAIALPRPDPAAAVAVPVSSRWLLGQTRAQLIDRLGPPVAITVAGGEMQWSYLDLRGRTLPGAVRLVRGRVTGVAEPDAVLVPGQRPERGPYLGQDAWDLVRERGTAGVERDGDREELTFYTAQPARFRVITFDDVVIEIPQ